MCKAAEKTAAALMAALEHPLFTLMTDTGIASTPAGQAAETAYQTALAALQNWVPGTAAQDTIQIIDAFTAAFDALPFPPEVQMLENDIAAAVVVVISVLTANSPAPVTTPPTVQAAHEAATSAAALAKVQKLVPAYKESLIAKSKAALGDHTVAAGEFAKQWNKDVATVSAVEPKYANLKLA
jgi:hypothetical protein